jgi:hypothetical protein
LPNQKRIDRGVALMERSKLSNFIDDPHQKFYYTFNFDRPFDFHVELIRILDDAPGVTYPFVSKSVGDAPKQFGNVVAPAATEAPEDEFDFLNELEYVAEDTEDFDEVADPEAVRPRAAADEHDDAEEDEFGNEFSDNEHFDEGLADKEDY